MLNFPRWKVITVFCVLALGLAYSAPNFIGEVARVWIREHLPAGIPANTVNLGLDLRGGAHLLYEVDVEAVFRERADLMVQDLRAQLRKEKIGYVSISAMDKGVRIVLRDVADGEKARKIVRSTDSGLDVLTGEDGRTIEAHLTEPAIKEIRDQTLSHSIEIVRRRVDELGTTEPGIQRQGENRIVLQVPGADAEALKRIVGKTAKLTFHLVSQSGGGRILPLAEDPTQKIPVDRRVMLSGDMLVGAQPSFDQNGQPVVSFRLNNAGARRFCDVTRNNVDKPFAIVLDSQVVSAPVIREPICGGQAQISGAFTLQEVNDTALLLRAGALPAPMRVMEERTVGPTLGSDSVKSGSKACVMALLFVMTMACTVYGLFGAFASVGLLVNMVLIIAVMSMLQATLTLPGIAGIVLTIGLAIDANVLIYERIKEELRAGRSILAAIDTGYQRARTTIMDSNLTALIAALILFSFGTGPIKGFAVTMCIGVATSYFCAMMFTRMLVLGWLNWKKPKVIPV